MFSKLIVAALAVASLPGATAADSVETKLVGSLRGDMIQVNTSSTTCGGNCPGGCDSCPCGDSSNDQDISAWCSKYSGWKQSSCECIMRHESGGNANAVNQNVGGSQDVGLWQINTQNWGSCAGGRPPCSPSVNLDCAKKVFAWGDNTWKLWSTCTVCGVCGSN
mmetsp:Transcript_24667/g.36173  ORF Transcript_24667/g.36173 Transcript_24667/m.36173 type:complete len:164 (+) Transcript_24667:69-560(+)